MTDNLLIGGGGIVLTGGRRDIGICLATPRVTIGLCDIKTIGGVRFVSGAGSRTGAGAGTRGGAGARARAGATIRVGARIGARAGAGVTTRTGTGARRIPLSGATIRGTGLTCGVTETEERYIIGCTGGTVRPASSPLSCTIRRLPQLHIPILFIEFLSR